ncbi:hypothetical protein [Actinophytocola sp.]|uniref:hypothetical protein n=1 Tax=Actinophytocola sp. TaxID=1872138 RepID=UPI002ED54FB1
MTPDLTTYDAMFVNVSGKDGRAALAVISEEAARRGVADRVWTVHADLGLIEWPGVTVNGTYWPSNRELVAAESAAYGVPPERHIVTWRTVTEDGGPRPQSLLEYIARRRMFPDPARRYCTSDVKVSKIEVSMTPILRELKRALRRPVRVLEVTGMRAEESASRADLPVLSVGACNSSKVVDRYLPVHSMSTADVRALNDASGVPHHWAYDSAPGANDWEGMSRLSCSLCIMSNLRDLVLAIRRRPRLARLYARVEERLGHRFRANASIASLIVRADEPGWPDPGVVLDEQTPEFDQLEADVLSALDREIPLRGGTGFTTQACAQACTGC